jgi:hypothetical protein
MNSRRLMGIPSARTPREPRLSHSRRRLLCITANFDGLCRLAAFAAIAGCSRLSQRSRALAVERIRRAQVLDQVVPRPSGSRCSHSGLRCNRPRSSRDGMRPEGASFLFDFSDTDAVRILDHCPKAMRDEARSSRRSSRRFVATSGPNADKPVMLPPGRARLLTNPLPTGSLAPANTIGMVDVACC